MVTSTPATAAETRDAAATLELLDELFEDYADPGFAVRLWDGSAWGIDPPRARGTLVLTRPGSLRHFLARASEAHLASCYMDGVVDVEGDMEAIIPVGAWVLGRRRSVAERLNLAFRAKRLPDLRLQPPDYKLGRARLRGAEHSLRRDRVAVTYHYDVSRRFYALWLDRRLVYSCALFSSLDDDLDTAQERKLEYICRKLRLRPGDRLLDIGCGWGGLILYAAERFGVQALGITLSTAQAEVARERVGVAGLEARCRVEVCDYRELDEADGFDKLVSVGMVEHVGRAQLDAYFGAASRLLRPGGAFLNHGIADLPARPPTAPDSFIDSHIFPDTELPAIPLLLERAEAHGFETRDVEGLREHYTLTLRRWLQRLQARREEAVAEVGEAVYRAWRLYMAGSAYWFDKGHIGVFQSLLVKPAHGRSGLPLLRSDWYDPPLPGLPTLPT